MIDLDHKMSSKLIQFAKENNACIVLEDLSKIRENTNKKNKYNKNSKRTVNTWAFYRLQQFILYKAKISGIPVFFIDPKYTSKKCSRCGEIGKRKGKQFYCPICGHLEHADVNAAFNIAKALIG